LISELTLIDFIELQTVIEVLPYDGVENKYQEIYKKREELLPLLHEKLLKEETEAEKNPIDESKVLLIT
jgi:hypothetical protein